MRQCLTAAVERDVVWEGEFATEPWEAAWASEAIFFVRLLSLESAPAGAGPLLEARVQISPDGTLWCDEGSTATLEAGQSLVAIRARHFGGWLRLCGAVAPGARLRVIAYLNLKE